MTTNDTTLATFENDVAPFQTNPAPAALSAEALAGQASEAFARGDLQEMHSLLTRARQISPYDSGIALALGHCELNRGNLDAALLAYTGAGDLRPDLSEPQSCRALALQLLGRTVDASQAASRALAKAPSDPVALKVLARIHLDSGRASLAKGMLGKILAATPDDTDALQMMEQAKALELAFANRAKLPAAPLPKSVPAEAAPVTSNPYTQMQKSQYERDADLMNQENHMFHNSNQDYWDILVGDTESNFRDKVGLDFGCGCGRNVMNLWMRFRRMDGCDISGGNLRHARENLIKCGCPPGRFELHEVNGVNLSGLNSDEYDFIMSTIVLQHIAVHDIRCNYFREFYRVMKPGGLLSFQMGYGEGYGKAGYYDNHYQATGTNSLHDTRVTDPEQIAGDLRKLGFVNIRHVIRPSYADFHPHWIFVKAEKPALAGAPAPQPSTAIHIRTNGGQTLDVAPSVLSVPEPAAKPALTAQEYFRNVEAAAPSDRMKPLVIFDIGANNGHTSVPVAQKHPHAQVYAFEPTPEMASQIEGKTKSLANYHLVRKAVSNVNGKAAFKVAGQADWGCSSLLNFSNKSRTEWPGRKDFVVTEEIEVDVMRLDSFIEEHGIERIDFLHIDTQGSDLNVLKGLGKYIAIVKQGAMEAAARADILYSGQNTQEESVKFLEENGFEILGVESNDDQRNEVNIFFKRKTRVRQYIVTYNNSKQINNCLASIFSKSSAAELEMLEVFVINNHSNIRINDEFLPRIKLLNNALRPNFSTGHLARNWNQALINGFKDLRAPDCDLVITNQDDTLFVENYLTKTLELHKQFDFVQFGWGDNFISYTPGAVKRIGLWDEKFCNIGYQEADYMTRARLLLKEKACINDFSHKRMFNAVDKSRYVIDLIPSGNARGEEYNHTSIRFHDHSKHVFEFKWGVNPDLGWEGVEVEKLRPRTQQYIQYPYFEKEVETLDEQNYLHKFPKPKSAGAHGGTPRPAEIPVVTNTAPALFNQSDCSDLRSPRPTTQEWGEGKGEGKSKRTLEAPLPNLSPARSSQGEGEKVPHQAVPGLARKSPSKALNIAVFSDKCDLSDLASAKVSYQAAQFAWLDKLNPLLWRNSPRWPQDGSVSAFEKSLGGKLDAAIVFDEFSLLNDSELARMRWDTDALLVYVSHDFWCHPLRVADRLRQFKNVLMVLRHETARELFDRLLPGVPKVVQRPGVETSIFHPNNGQKDNDVLLGGSETPDYPLRQRINRLVRQNAARLNWKVVDLTAAGLMSNPPGVQREYSLALAASKVSPTASNRGGGQGAKLVTQYFDLSPARAQFDHEFYGLKNPEISVEGIDTAGITPRYLESFATKSFLVADLPPNDSQEWYRDKMGVISPDMKDGEILSMIDYWVRHDREREAICGRAWLAVQAGETSEHKAAELLEIIQSNL
jgi:FkbM family methyltransferase